MLDKVKEYFENEYRDCVRAIACNYTWITSEELVDRAISECLAVAMFSQTIGVTYEEVDSLYEEIKKRLENLLTD